VKRRKTPIVLSLSGSDPSGGAGQEADLKAYLRHGVYGLNLTTLLTVQNSLGVKAVRPLDPGFLEKQWDALFEDMPPDVI
jgi:hydroxymethylpyrimidine/phosphomethylpyrimidine kinase